MVDLKKQTNSCRSTESILREKDGKRPQLPSIPKFVYFVIEMKLKFCENIDVVNIYH